MVITKNAEKVIAKCLSSIVEQAYQPHEIIVVDGRSTDKTRNIASRFPVKLILAPLKDTYGASRNLGVKKAKGNIVAFLDADDYAERTWLESILKAFSRTDAGVINPNRIYFYPKNWFTDLKWNKMRKKRRLKDRPHKVEESWMSFGTTGSAFRKELIEKAGYFDEDMFFGTEDKDIALRILRMGYKISSEPNAIIYFMPSSSVKEWLKETFYRHGLGHGTIRKKHGKYKPPFITPSVTVLAFFYFLILFMHGLWQLILISLCVPMLAIAAKTYSLFIKTKCTFTHALAYTTLEVLGRNLEFLGFMIGFLIPTKFLRRLWRY